MERVKSFLDPLVNWAMNYIYDVCQFKRQYITYCISRKLHLIQINM